MRAPDIHRLSPASRASSYSYFIDPGLSLAKPRFTLGYISATPSRVNPTMLEPAPRAIVDVLFSRFAGNDPRSLRQRLRLAVDEVVHHYDVVFLVIVWTRR